jgi:DNA-binding XRE family transcriptional regulator
MARTLDEVIKGLPVDQQQEIEARAAQLIEDELTLRDLRKAHELTQTRMAEALHISQDGVSRLEKRSDFLLSTLRSYVEAMGGRLRRGFIIAGDEEFNQRRVHLDSRYLPHNDDLHVLIRCCSHK